MASKPVTLILKNYIQELCNFILEIPVPHELVCWFLGCFFFGDKFFKLVGLIFVIWWLIIFHTRFKAHIQVVLIRRWRLKYPKVITLRINCIKYAKQVKISPLSKFNNLSKFTVLVICSSGASSLFPWRASWVNSISNLSFLISVSGGNWPSLRPPVITSIRSYAPIFFKRSLLNYKKTHWCIYFGTGTNSNIVIFFHKIICIILLKFYLPKYKNFRNWSIISSCKVVII